MKLVKSLLLGSAAGLCAVAGAQAADLPVRKSAPVEYVRVCTAYGAGFFYIPGTDTCLRVGGRARFEYEYINQRSRNSSDSGYRGLGRLNLDARTQTAYGTLRAFVRFEIASRTGGYLKSGTQERYANAFTGTGIDTASQAQQFVNVDKAFVQFAGFTAGRASSFFDFYAHDLEFIGSSVGSDVSSTNLIAYTATVGNGFSATLSAEDPTFRRNPVFYNVAAGLTGLAAGATPSAQNGTNFQTGALGLAFVGNAFNAAGVPTSAVALNVAQVNNVPDVVGAVRYDAPWGSAQVSAASHEIRTSSYNLAAGTFGANGGVAVPIGAPGSIVPRLPQSEYGYAVQGGAKFNLPQLGTGDVLWLQAAYAKGADSYTGVVLNGGSETITNSNTNRQMFGAFDAFTDAQGRLHLTESYSGTVSLLHYYSPEWRQGIFGSYGRVHFDQALRNPTQSFVGAFSPVNVGAATFAGGIFNSTGKDYSHIYVGSNLIWSPVRDLDIGVEAIYDRLEFLGGASKGRVVDMNKTPTAAFALRTISVDDQVQVRVRVQRDF